MPDINLSTLANIQTKVRRVTRSPSPSQLNDATINNYVNNFVLYDFPEQLRLFNLRKTLTFYVSPYIDTYSTNTVNPSDPLYNFKNKYISVHQPMYVAGFEVFFSQSREQFYGIYPKVNTVYATGFVGNGVATNFVGQLPILTAPGVPTVPSRGYLQNQVLFSSVDANNLGLALVDSPVSASLGNLRYPNDPVGAPIRGTFNYITGVYTLNFASAPAVGANINAQVVPYQASRPLGCLYYADTFTFRPVPDQPYRVDIEVYQRPEELLLNNQMPELSEWWEYIALNTAKKVFEDRSDPESVQQIMPIIKEKEVQILRRCLMQLSNERTASIYTEQVAYGPSGNGWGFGGSGPF